MVERLPPDATKASVRALFDGVVQPADIIYIRVVDPHVDEQSNDTLTRLAALCRKHGPPVKAGAVSGTPGSTASATTPAIPTPAATPTTTTTPAAPATDNDREIAPGDVSGGGGSGVVNGGEGGGAPGPATVPETPCGESEAVPPSPSAPASPPATSGDRYAVVQLVSFEIARPAAEAVAARLEASGSAIVVSYTEDRSRRRTKGGSTPAGTPSLGSDTPRGFTTPPAAAGGDGGGVGGSSNGSLGHTGTGTGTGGASGTPTPALSWTPGRSGSGPMSPPGTARSLARGGPGTARRGSGCGGDPHDTERTTLSTTSSGPQGSAASSAAAALQGSPGQAPMSSRAAASPLPDGLGTITTPPLSRAGSGGIPGGRPTPASLVVAAAAAAAAAGAAGSPPSGVAISRNSREEDSARWSALRSGNGIRTSGPQSARAGPVVPPLRGFGSAVAASAGLASGVHVAPSALAATANDGYYTSPRGSHGSAASPTARGSGYHNSSGGSAGGGHGYVHASPRQAAGAPSPRQIGPGTTAYALPPGAVGYVYAVAQPPLPPGPPPSGPIPATPPMTLHAFSPHLMASPSGGGGPYSGRVPGLPIAGMMSYALGSPGTASGSGGSDHGFGPSASPMLGAGGLTLPPGYVLVPAMSLSGMGPTAMGLYQPPLPPGPPPPLPPHGYDQQLHLLQAPPMPLHEQQLQMQGGGVQMQGLQREAYISPRLQGQQGGIASSGPHSARRWARSQNPAVASPGAPPAFHHSSSAGGGAGDPDAPLDPRASPGGGSSSSSAPATPLVGPGVHDPSADTKVARGPDVGGSVGFGRVRTPRDSSGGPPGPVLSPRTTGLALPPPAAAVTATSGWRRSVSSGSDSCESGGGGVTSPRASGSSEGGAGAMPAAPRMSFGGRATPPLNLAALPAAAAARASFSGLLEPLRSAASHTGSVDSGVTILHSLGPDTACRSAQRLALDGGSLAGGTGSLDSVSSRVYESESSVPVTPTTGPPMDVTTAAAIAAAGAGMGALREAMRRALDDS